MANELKDLPLHIIKLNRYFYVDTKTGKKVHRDRIKDYLPKPVEVQEIEREKIENANWQSRYYGN